MEKQGAQDKDKDEGKAHEGIGVAQVELSHGRHPKKGGYQSRNKTQNDEWVYETSK